MLRLKGFDGYTIEETYIFLRLGSRESETRVTGYTRHSAAIPPIWRLQVHEAIGSTSDHCAALAAAGEPAGLAVLALRQTSGRGSRGRGWQSPIGNLSLSVLLRPSGTLGDAGSWPLLVGIAVAEAARPLLPDPAALSLKWPNDVLLRGRKLAGILIDTALDQAGGLRWLIIGIGANLAVAPEVPGRVTACLPDEGVAPPPPEAFARDVLDRLAHWHSVLLRRGFQRSARRGSRGRIRSERR